MRPEPPANRPPAALPPPGTARAWLLFPLLAALGCGPAAPAPRGALDGAGPRALRVLPDRVDGGALLSNDAALASRAGAGPLRVVGVDLVSEGDRVGGFVEIPDGECMLAFARCSPTIGDVDLFAFEDDGSTFSTDEAPDARATILVCPPHPRRLYLAARVMSGAGAVSVGVQSVPAAEADRVARAVSARGRPGEESGRLESWPGLEAKIRAHRAAIGGRWDDVRRVALPVGARAPSRVSAQIEAGRCLDVLVSPSDEIASLEVVAEDAAGRIVARARERGQDRALILCSAVAAELSITVRARASQGLAAVILGRSPVGAEPEIAGAVPIARVTEARELTAARASHGRALDGRGFGAPKTSTGAARLGSRTTLPIELPAGCARVDVIAGKPLADVLAELWSDRSELIGSGRGGALATLHACGPGGPARLDVEALGRPGPFAVEVRKDPAAPAPLVTHPVATARLLGRMGAADAAAGAAAQVVALDAGRLWTLPFTVPATTCVEVIAAVGEGGNGIDLRLVDASTREGTVARARHVVSDRRCAGKSVVTGSIELRLAAGKGDALVLIRPVGSGAGP